MLFWGALGGTVISEILQRYGATVKPARGRAWRRPPMPLRTCWRGSRDIVRSLGCSVNQSRRIIMPHPAMSPNNVAVVTGGASGIGLAAATRFARLGMKVCIADLGADRLKQAETKLSSLAPGGAADVMTASVDVSRADEVAELESAVRKRFGGTDILMNN